MMRKKITNLCLSITFMMLSILCCVEINVNAAESNTSQSNAISVETGRKYTGCITSEENEHWYKIQTDENLSSYTFHVICKDEYVDFHLYDSIDAEIESVEMYNVHTEGDERTVKLNNNSVYYMKIEYNSFMVPANYTFIIDKTPDEADTMEDAGQINCGITRGNLCTGDDIDYYKFTTDPDLASYTFTIIGKNDSVEFNLYDEMDTAIDGTNMFNVQSEGEKKTVKLDQNTTYYIGIKGYYSEWTDYTLRIEKNSDEADTINDADQISCGTTRGNLCTSNDTDYYKLTTGTSDANYTFKIVGKEDSVNLILYDRSGSKLEAAEMFNVGSVGEKGTVKLKMNTTYYVEITGYGIESTDYILIISSENKGKGTPETQNFSPAKTSISHIKNIKGKKITLKWKKVKKCDGYQIQCSANKSFNGNVKFKKISNNTTTKTNINKLKKGRKYYIRIRTYKIVSGKTYYSGWSGIKKVKIRK